MVVDEHDAPTHDGAPRDAELDLGALARASTRSSREPPARSSRPWIDSVSPRRSAGTAARSKPDAAVADEHRDLVVGHLDVDVDLLDARELGGVRHRLARGEHDRAVGRRRGVARARELDAHAGSVLDVGRRGRERRDERGAVVPERPVGVEPAAQLALLPARERGDAVRLARVPLDERERLEHRVVDARGDVGALLAADPGRCARRPARARAARATARR